MDTVTNFRTFMAVAQAGSFSAAARGLGLATSVITKRIDQLEWRAGQQLFERSTRRLKLTDQGQRLLPVAQRIVQDVDDAFRTVLGQPQRLEGHLRIKVPTTLAVVYLNAVLADFQCRHADVSMDVVVIDRPVNLVEEGFDIAVGMLPPSFDTVVETGLSPLARHALAAPGYLQAHGVPDHPTDLAQHRLLNFQPTGPTWTFTGPQGPIRIEVKSHLSTNDGNALLQATLQGVGIAVLSSYMTGAALRAGRLVQVLPAFPVPPTWIRAQVPVSRMHLGRVQALLSCLKDAFADPAWESRCVL